jgi:hypothetical protein
LNEAERLNIWNLWNVWNDWNRPRYYSIRHVSRLGCVQDQPKQGDRGKTKSDPSNYRLGLALNPQSSLVLGQASSDDQHQ